MKFYGIEAAGLYNKVKTKAVGKVYDLKRPKTQQQFFA